MIDISTALMHYKREDVQKEMIYNAKDREIAIKYGDKGFGTRPDVLRYEKDVLELAKQGATSFHASEELWENVLQLSPSMHRKDMDNLRIGWDLVIDIDCPVWSISKITTWLIIKALRENGVSSISLKFSGNKGFHIGIPFEVFPKKVGNNLTKNLFPDAAKKIALYLLDFVASNHIKIKSNIIGFGNKFKMEIDKLSKLTNKDISNLTYFYCKSCKERFQKREENQEEGFVVSYDLDFIHEKKYEEKIWKRIVPKNPCCCRKPEYVLTFNPSSVIDIDTLLISSRHLYRMPYSLHEKSGLCSIPIDPEKILDFRKEMAIPKNVNVSKLRFLDKSNVKKGEAKKLLVQAFDFDIKKEEIHISEKKEFDKIETAIPEQFFPPCIEMVTKGLKDGRKRAVFILINFLSSIAWSYDMIERYLIEWNKKNPEPLREVYWKGQLRYHKTQNKKILPPNCNNKIYYQDMHVCFPDNLCSKIKNPVNYAVLKAKGFKNRTKE